MRPVHATCAARGAAGILPRMRWLSLAVVAVACSGPTKGESILAASSTIGQVCTSLATEMCAHYAACGRSSPTCESDYYDACCLRVYPHTSQFPMGMCDLPLPLFGEAEDAYEAAQGWDGCH